MKRKLFCLFLSIVVLLSVFAGCTQKQPATSDPDSSTPKPTEQAKTSEPKETTADEEPMELTIRMHYHGDIDTTLAKQGIDYNDNKIANFHREHSGVNVTFEPALADGTQEQQKKAMILASNDTPDIMLVGRDDYFKYAMQGALTETEPYLEKMPDYLALVQQYEGVLDAVRYKGKLYCFPSILEAQDMNATHGGGIIARKDVMEDLGISTPKTIEDYYDMWKTVQEKTDYIPLSTAGGNFSAIRAAFRVALQYKEVGDKLEYIWVQPEYKEYLAFMNRLYSEGLLDKEYITTTGVNLTEKFMGDQLFSSNQGWAYGCVNVRDIGEKIEGAEMVYLPQPSGPDGSKALLFFGWPVQKIWVVPKAAKNKDAAAKFMNYMATAEAKMTQDYGIENEDFTIGADGKPVYTQEQQMNITWRIVYEIMDTPESFKIRLYGKGYDWAYNQALDGQKDADFTTNLFSIMPPNDDFQKLQQRLSLDTFVDEETAKFIMGDRPISEFDQFVQELKNKGLDEQTEGLNKWYDEYKQSK
jgi:putative aldouronate transport system substrate-binding protein